jgi:serine/threonine protein kinase/tetratricopeptide (TPR) repeat protein
MLVKMGQMINITLAHYKITGKLGAGGMGEVYRASDTKLGREVAIKVLPAEFASSKERLARFEREAKALAQLNHPNVGSIHGFDHEGGTYFLVLELIEGDTLQERILKGPLSVEEGLKVFRQIAAALEAAHEKGIVHRDLKPANIKIDPRGLVKVLDFGLSKVAVGSRSGVTDSEESGSTLADSMAPTITSQFTMPGKVMGTAAYMSPEQSRGQEVDRRTDVWAFGCCLYEALTGRKPFKGQTASDLMAEILKTDPDFTVIPPETPGEVLGLLRRSLEKDPRRRLRDLGDIAIALEDVSATTRISSARLQQSDLSSIDHTESGKSGYRKILKLGRLIGTVILALCFSYAVWTVLINRQGDDSGASIDSHHAIRTLIVQPFVNAKEEDSDSQWLSKTLHQALKHQLKPLDRLEIKPAGYVDVDATVKGTFVREGEQLHVTVTLVNHTRQTEETLGNYTKAAIDIFQLQNDIAISIAEQISSNLSEEERALIEREDDINPEAYITYRKGIDALDVSGFANADEVISYFQRAIQIDSRFLPPYLQQAWAHWWPTIYGTESTTAIQAFEKSFTVLDAAEAVFPDEPIIATTRTFFRAIVDFDFLPAKEALDGALLEAPDDPDLNFMKVWYSIFVEARYLDAMLLIDRMILEDSDRIAFHDARAEAFSFMGRESEAMMLNASIAAGHAEDFDRLINNALSQKQIGDLDSALVNARKAVGVSANHPAALCILAEIHAAREETGEARRLLDQVEERRAAGWFVPLIFSARAEAELNRPGAALRLLEAAHQNKEGWSLMYSLRSPRFIGLMADTKGFWKLISDMGYPALPFDHPYYEKEQEMRYGVGSSVADVSASGSPNSIAVLPFSTAGSDEDDALSEGLTEDMTGMLQKISGLTVRGGRSASRFKDISDTKEVGEGLDVDHLLYGKVSREGSQIRINVNLVVAATDKLLWSEAYDHDISSIFTTRTKVAQEVARQLQVELGVEEERELEERGTDNAEAYALYLQGRAHWNRRTLGDFEKAEGYFKAALLLDENFAVAYSGLADVHALWGWYSGSSSGSHSKLTFEFAERAEKLNPRLAQPHATLGWAKGIFHSDWEGAELEFDTAITLNPNYANGYHWLADMLLILGRPEQALVAARRSVELDPTSINHATVANALIFLGKTDDAVAYLQKRIEEDPTFLLYRVRLGEAFIEKKMFARAAGELDLLDSTEVSKERLMAMRARVFALMGKTSEARRLLKELDELMQTSSDLGGSIAIALISLGDDDAALTRLERLVASRGDLMGFLFSRRVWIKLHDHPRYQAVLRTLNLLD